MKYFYFVSYVTKDLNTGSIGFGCSELWADKIISEFEQIKEITHYLEKTTVIGMTVVVQNFQLLRTEID